MCVELVIELEILGSWENEDRKRSTGGSDLGTRWLNWVVHMLI